jgi:hypothetical protein
MAWKRTTTSQPATGAPELIAIPGLTGATEIISPGDYSVPDPNRTWADFRDPDDPARRRIQPGQILVETPLLLYNTSESPVTVEVYAVLQDGTRADQLRIVIPGNDTYTHSMPGQIFRKTGLAKEAGDRLFVRPLTDGVINITVSVSSGAVEQDQPLQGSPSFIVETG